MPPRTPQEVAYETLLIGVGFLVSLDPEPDSPEGRLLVKLYDALEPYEAEVYPISRPPKAKVKKEQKWRKIRFGERLEAGDERLRSSGGSCCLPGGWFPIASGEVGEKRSHSNSGHGLRRPVKTTKRRV